MFPSEFRLCPACQRVHAGHVTCPDCRSSLTLVNEDFFLGRLFGKYQVRSLLGRGGMGVVFLAVHTTLGKRAALKVVSPDLIQDEHAARRFLREARVLAELKHPSIVEIYDFDESEWGLPYYVMEFLPGVSLRAILKDRPPGATFEDYRSLLRDVARGLAFAHRKGIIHRDLKPENLHVVLEDGRARAKVLDFGIAKLLHVGAQDYTRTRTGAVVGTPLYLAPEQIFEQEVGPHTDQYALGLIVAEIFTGKAVRGGMTVGEIYASEAMNPAVLSRTDLQGAPARVAQALRRATEKDPTDRFPDVMAFIQALGLPESEADGACFHLPEPPPAESLPPAATAAGPDEDATVLRRSPATGLGALPDSLRRTVPIPRPTASQGLETFPATAPAAPTRPRFRFRFRRVPLLFAGAALVLAAGLGAWAWHRNRVPARAAAVAPLLEHLSELGTPSDSQQILATTDQGVILQGADCVYLLEADPKVPPSRIPLLPGERILGGSSAGRLYLQQGKRLVFRNYTSDGRLARTPGFLPDGGDSLIAPDASWAARLGERDTELFQWDGARWLRRFAVPIGRETFRRTATGRPLAVLGTRHFAFLAGDTLELHELVSSRRLLGIRVVETRVNALALDEATGRVAVGGWFNHVLVADPAREGAEVRIPVQGQVHALLFLPDAPTLAIGGEGGLQLWRPDSGVVARWGALEDDLVSLHRAGGALMALDAKRRRVHSFAYRGFPLQQQRAITTREIWALAASKDGRELYIGGGGSDGNLYRFRPAEDRVDAFPLHAQGITSLVTEGTHLASASDDKSIAVWRLPDLAVVWRSQAHGFLVNQLFLQGRPPGLWSASSDGTVKKWSWPLLEVQETLETQSTLGRRLACQALWVSPGEDLVLAGTWAGQVLVFRRRGGRWAGETLPVPSPGIYTAVHLPAAEAVLLVGCHFPSGIYVFDLRTGRLSALPHLDTTLTTAISGAGPGETLVLGEGTVFAVRLVRTPDGALDYALGGRFHSDLGSIVAAARLTGPARVALGDERGRLSLVDDAALAIPSLLRGRIPGPTAR